MLWRPGTGEHADAATLRRLTMVIAAGPVDGSVQTDVQLGWIFRGFLRGSG